MTSYTYKLGDRVSYEDMANPRRTGTVVETIEHGGTTPSGHPLPSSVEFRVRFDNREETVSDLRQAGWKRLPKARNAAAIAKRVQEIAKTANRHVAMQLLTAEDVRALPPLYAQDGTGEDATAYVKFFGSGRWTWYATEASAVIDTFDGEAEVALDDVHDASRIQDIRFSGRSFRSRPRLRRTDVLRLDLAEIHPLFVSQSSRDRYLVLRVSEAR
jgi:hypothetical protein